MQIRWPHDVHVLVGTQEMAARLKLPLGRLVHVQAGDTFEMPDDEANARIEAGDVIKPVVAEKVTTVVKA